MALGVGVDAAAEVQRQHLGAEADAKEGFLFRQRHRQPVDLLADEVIGVVGAHGAAEDHRAGVLGHGGGQRVAEARPTDVERVAALLQRVADPSRS